MDRNPVKLISLLASIMLIVFCPGAAQSNNTQIPYQGSSLKNTPQILKLRSLINLVDSLASKQAEDLTGLPLDRSRLHLRLVDAPEGLTKFHVAMTTSGHDTIIVSVRSHIWLRSASKDSLAALQVMTHEYVHAILRQNMKSEDYRRLPKWLKEGVAVHIAGQHHNKLLVALARKWKNPDSLHEGLADGPTANVYLRGSWWFRALNKAYGPDATRRLIGLLVKERNLYDACVAFGCSIEEVWYVAEQYAATEVARSSSVVGPRLKDCLAMRSNDPKKCRKCLGKLIDDFPESYAAEYALYIAAKLSYQQQYLKDARNYLTQLSQCRRSYGNESNALYLRIIIASEANRHEETRQYCEEYFVLWPDGNFWGRVQGIYRNLP